MSRSFNQVTLMGNLTKDPELRTTPSGTNVCNFSLALNRSYKDGSGEWKEVADYVDIVTFNKLAENVQQYLQKGRQAIVSGRLQSRQWEQDGQKRVKLEVLANEVIFMNQIQNDNTTEPQQEKPKIDEEKQPEVEDVVVEDIGDEPINLDDIPF